MNDPLGDLLKAADAEAVKRAKGEEMAEHMLAWLRLGGGWLTRADMQAKMGLDSSRLLSLGREFSGGRIIYGQRGFRASENATIDELQACANQVRAQIRAEQAYCASVEQYLRSKVPNFDEIANDRLGRTVTSGKEDCRGN
jgi:hypothetical protein